MDTGMLCKSAERERARVKPGFVILARMFAFVKRKKWTPLQEVLRVIDYGIVYRIPEAGAVGKRPGDFVIVDEVCNHICDGFTKGIGIEGCFYCFSDDIFHNCSFLQTR